MRRTCFFTEFRTHSADIRNAESGKYIADTIIKAFKIMSTAQEVSEAFEKIFPDFTFDDIMEELIALYSAKDNVETINLYFDSPFFKKYSRTLHEFYKLPRFLQRKLKEKLLIAAESNTESKYTMCHDSKEREWMKLALRHYLYNKNKNFNAAFKDNIETIFMCYGVSLGVKLLDIYTISRALKSFDGGLPSQLSVVYQGDAHIKHQIELLNDYYDIVKTWGTHDYSNVDNVIKCID